ncbi:MAG: outer membrane beta-barrel protein [Bacteroidales bacterium]|nr:outer membrane beta-barrel protein [Bacteroidales bacterium]
MIENKEKEFDLMVRSLMADAEEDVPSRVWDAIDSRLPQSSPVPVWWRWAGAAFAAVAVLAFALILGGTFSKPSIDILPQSGSVVAESLVSPSSESGIRTAEPVYEDIPADASQQVTASAGRGIVVKPSVTINSEQASEKTTEVQSQPVRSIERRFDRPSEKSDEKVTEIQEAKETPTESAVEGKDIDWDTYFKDEDTRKTDRSRTSVELNGILGSNDGVSKSSILYGIEALPSPESFYTTGITESSSSLYGIPLTFGFGLRFYLTDRFSLGTGINYSLLTRSFKGTYIQADNGKLINSVENADIVNHIHYIGIPVNAYYDLIQNNLIQFYAFGGATFEKGLGSNFRITKDGTPVYYNESVPGMQVSAALGIGIQFNVAKSWSLYIDPSARYYFDCKQPKSVRTQKPFMFNFEVGIRYNI